MIRAALRARRTDWFGCALAIFALGASSPGQSRPASAPASAPASQGAREFREDRSAGYKLDDGPYKVSSEADFELYDKARDKTLHLVIRYPRGVPLDQRLPLILFSHGAGGSGEAFSELSEHWAGHGYVVIHPTHSDSLRLRRRQGEDLSGLRADPDRLRRSVDILGRLADMKLILDSLEKIENKIGPLKAGPDGRIDRARIGIAGHSAGAFTTQVALGAKIRTPGSRSQLQNLADERFRAGIVISGQGLTTRSFRKDSWDDLRKPMMVFAGSLDVAAIGNETPESRQHPYEYAPAGDKYLVFIEGATHGSYQGRERSRVLHEKPTTDARLITDVVASATLAFWDSYLKSDLEGGDYLRGDRLVTLGGGAVISKRK